MSDALLPYLDPQPERPNDENTGFAQLRVVPFQPAGLALAVVYMGAELGNLPWAGSRPNAGDTVAVVGSGANRLVIPRVKARHRDPIFGDRCVCRCPGSSTGGIIFLLMNDISFTTILLAVDGETGDVLLYQVPIEVVSGAGIAVDAEAPHDLYILDDRSGAQNLVTDSVPANDPAKQWVFVLKYTLSGSSYQFAAAQILPGYPTESPRADDTNSLTVIDGVLWMPLVGADAVIRQWNGTGFTDLSLTLDGEAYAADLFGPVVKVPDRPAPTTSYFVLARVENDSFTELIQFTAEGVIQNRLRDDDMASSKALLSVCNKLFLFNSIGSGRSDSDAFPEPEPEDPDEEPGEEQ